MPEQRRMSLCAAMLVLHLACGCQSEIKAKKFAREFKDHFQKTTSLAKNARIETLGLLPPKNLGVKRYIDWSGVGWLTPSLHFAGRIFLATTDDSKEQAELEAFLAMLNEYFIQEGQKAGLRIVTRVDSEVAQLIEERDFTSVFADSATLQKLGRLYGADALLFIECRQSIALRGYLLFSAMNHIILLRVRLVSVHTGEVLHSWFVEYR